MQQKTNSFGKLLERYIAGGCSPEEEEVVYDWYRSLGKERKMLSLSKEEKLALERKLWQNIRGKSWRSEIGAGRAEETGGTKEKRPGKPGMRWFIYLPGAAAVLVAVFLFVTKQEGSLPAGEESGLRQEVSVHQKVNNTGKTVLVVLQDESMVWLKPSGSIRYTEFSMSPRREVSLSGEAYFEVAKNPEKPFLVYSGNVVTRVTGTKFNIKAYEKGETVEVEVTEGTVEVSGGKEKLASGPELSGSADVKLIASQKAVYHTASRKLEKLAVIESPLKKIEKLTAAVNFEFSDTPFRKVIDLLATAYEIPIELENESLGNCPLTASLNDETLDVKLELICKSVGATYSKSPGKIMISGEGCIK